MLTDEKSKIKNERIDWYRKQRLRSLRLWEKKREDWQGDGAFRSLDIC